jgi:hypothetical protein
VKWIIEIWIETDGRTGRLDGIRRLTRKREITWTTAERKRRGQRKGSGSLQSAAGRAMTSLPKISRDNGLADRSTYQWVEDFKRAPDSIKSVDPCSATGA